MKIKTKNIFSWVFCCIAVIFTSCSKSPTSMVKKFGIWQIAEDDEWRDGFYTNPTWEQVIKKYKYFANYSSSNWSDQKLGGQWYLHYVYYTTKFNDRVPDEKIDGFVINNKKNVSGKEALDYFKKSIELSESRTYGGFSVIYSTQDKAKFQELITALEAGNITDVSFSNADIILKWITNKRGNADYGEQVVFIGTYIIADVKLEKNDGTEISFERLGFYTTPHDPLDPYRYNKPYNSY